MIDSRQFATETGDKGTQPPFWQSPYVIGGAAAVAIAGYYLWRNPSKVDAVKEKGLQTASTVQKETHKNIAKDPNEPL
jgi:hypothetical protein